MTTCSVVMLCALFTQAYGDPGRFYHDYHKTSNPDGGNRHATHPWDRDWGSHSWDQHDWFSGYHTNHRHKTTRKPTTVDHGVNGEQGVEIDVKSTSPTPRQPVIRDVEIRNGVTSAAFTITATSDTSVVPTDDKKSATTENIEVRTPPEISVAKTNVGDIITAVSSDILTANANAAGVETATFNTANTATVAEDKDLNAGRIESTFNTAVISVQDATDNEKLTINTAGIATVDIVNQMSPIPNDLENSSQWHVGIYTKTEMPYRQICGGSLLKSDTVLSAAHCFWTSEEKQLPTDQFAAAAGKLHRAWDDPRDRNAQYSDIKTIIISKMYPPCYPADLAVLTLATPFTYGSAVKPVCLNYDADFEKRQLKKGNIGLIAGWGEVVNNCTPSQSLSWSRLPFVEQIDCNTDLVFITTYGDENLGEICAGTVGDKTQCDSDSGSGLVFFDNNTPYLRGVATFRGTSKLCLTFRTPSFTKLTPPPIHGLSVELHPFEECLNFYNSTATNLREDAPSPIDVTSGMINPIPNENTSQKYPFTILPTGDPIEDGRVGTLATGATPVPGLNGTNAPTYQWHVGVYTKQFTPYMQICGGSLIKRDVVLSAAHCFWEDATGQQPASMYAVASGKLFRPWNYTPDTYGQQSNVSEIVLPVRFRGSTMNFQDDVAVVRLSTPFTYALGVQPVCVNFDAQFEKRQLRGGNKGTVAGWGLNAANGSPSQRLNYLELPYVEIGDCISQSDVTFLKYITSDKICAGDQKTGKALCRGDSGGGLVLYSGAAPYLRGIASTAPSNDNLCNDFAIASFTQITAHRNFLIENIPDIDKECRNVDFSRFESPGNVAEGIFAPPFFGGDAGFTKDPNRNVNAKPTVGTNEPFTSNVLPEISTVGYTQTTPPIYSVPYNNFVCNCHCKP